MNDGWIDLICKDCILWVAAPHVPISSGADRETVRRVVILSTSTGITGGSCRREEGGFLVLPPFTPYPAIVGFFPGSMGVYRSTRGPLPFHFRCFLFQHADMWITPTSCGWRPSFSEEQHHLRLNVTYLPLKLLRKSQRAVNILRWTTHDIFDCVIIHWRKCVRDELHPCLFGRN